MESTGFLKIAEEISQVSIQANVFKSSSSIQLNVTGLWPLRGPLVLSLRMSHAEFSKSFTTQKMWVKNGIISQTTYSISNGVSLRWPKTTPYKSLMKEFGSPVMTPTQSIRAIARRSLGQPILICTCPMISLQHLQ